MLRPSTLTNRSSIRTATFMCSSALLRAPSSSGDASPWHELEAPHPVRNIGLGIGDRLRLLPGGCAKDDHAGAETVAGIVEERPGPDQEPLGFQVVDEVVVAGGQLLLPGRGRRWRIHHLIIDHLALLARVRSGSAHGSPPWRAVLR